MKKIFSTVMFFILFISLLMGCMNNNTNQNQQGENVKDFKSDKAQEVSDMFLNLLCENNLAEANNLLTDELKEKSKNQTLGDTQIIAYKMDKVVESSDNASIVYDIVRVKKDDILADRDTITIKVKSQGEDYKISEVNATNRSQVYSKDRDLRLMGEEGGDSQLILNIDNLYIDLYPKNEGASIEKVQIPHNDFGVVTISYSGKKVGLTTKDGTKNFIAVVDIDEGLVANATEGGGENNTKENEKKETSEKSIAKKIIPLDILDVDEVDKLIFTSDEEKIIVQYTYLEKGRIRVYTTTSAELIETNIEKEFPSDEYSIEFIGLEKKLIKFKAKNKDSEKIYTLDLEDNEIKEK